MQGNLGHIGATGQGAFGAPVGAAMAMVFDVVHVVGTIEDSLLKLGRLYQ